MSFWRPGCCCTCLRCSLYNRFLSCGGQPKFARRLNTSQGCMRCTLKIFARSNTPPCRFCNRLPSHDLIGRGRQYYCPSGIFQPRTLGTLPLLPHSSFQRGIQSKRQNPRSQTLRGNTTSKGFCCCGRRRWFRYFRGRYRLRKVHTPRLRRNSRTQRRKPNKVWRRASCTFRRRKPNILIPCCALQPTILHHLKTSRQHNRCSLLQMTNSRFHKDK